MPLNLNQECHARLHEVLKAALPTITINNGMFPNRSSIDRLIEAERVLPQTGKLRDRLVEYVDDFPFTEFILDMLGEELWHLDKYRPDTNPKLTEIQGYNDADAVAARLLGQFESLPWQYRLTVKLPDALGELLHTAETAATLSPSIWIVRATEEFAHQFPLETTSDQLNQRLAGEVTLLNFLSKEKAKPKWDHGSVYFQIAAEGFIGQYGASATSSYAERHLRSLFGMGLATRLLDFKHTYSSIPPKTFVYLHRRSDDGTWEPRTRYELNDAVSRCIANLRLHDLGGPLLAQHMPRWVSARLSDISAAFRSGERSEPTILAAQWLFDSYAGHDPLLSFVQSMVVLEIVLGDKAVSDEIGIGELISNRFAYLVGTTHEERTDLIAEFKKIYKVRSQIVHSGKHSLNLDERALFQRLRWMCRRAIDKEIDLLKAGLSKEPLAVEK
jgi:hypothetical protein